MSPIQHPCYSLLRKLCFFSSNTEVIEAYSSWCSSSLTLTYTCTVEETPSLSICLQIKCRHGNKQSPGALVTNPEEPPEVFKPCRFNHRKPYMRLLFSRDETVPALSHCGMGRLHQCPPPACQCWMKVLDDSNDLEVGTSWPQQCLERAVRMYTWWEVGMKTFIHSPNGTWLFKIVTSWRVYLRCTYFSFNFLLINNYFIGCIYFYFIFRKNWGQNVFISIIASLLMDWKKGKTM